MDIEYKTVYSNRRTISIIVNKNGLTVRAPLGTSHNRIEEIIDAHASWIEKAIKKQSLRKSSEDLSEERIDELKKSAKLIIPKKVEHYSKIMGLTYGRITITSAKTRFGSCSAKGNLSFSYRLMLYPDVAIDYVVIHELAHRVHMDHSRAFYKTVEKYMPDYKNVKQLLKD
jgi:predicted metal-dependent hydrolase